LGYVSVTLITVVTDSNGWRICGEESDVGRRDRVEWAPPILRKSDAV
jgi:hypothetical protein